MKKSIILLSIIILAGCTTTSINNDTTNTQLANPSATYCVEQGGTYDIRDEAGGQAGYCVFSDGSECPGWDYYRGDCSPSESITQVETINQFVASSPVADFNETIINDLGVDCSGSEAEIAECIYDWQASNMIFTQTNADKGPFNQPYPIRWQEVLPGIYTSKDVINEQVTSEGKLYGICFDFAVVYCSIAEYYGLKCRIQETIFNVNNETRPGGMSTAEYEKLTPYMIRAGVNYTYEAVRLSMPDSSEVPGHYWAEVKLDEVSDYDDNGWRVMDASNQKYDGRGLTMNYIKNGTYNIVNWLSKDKSELLANYTARELSGENIGQQNEGNMTDQETFEQGRDIFQDDVDAGRAEEYVGITDDLGQSGRAEKIDDFMQGKGLAPYFNDCSDVCDFFQGTIAICDSECPEENAFYNCYEDCSGDYFYKVCDYVCDEGSGYASCYESCSGVALNNDCNDNC